MFLSSAVITSRKGIKPQNCPSNLRNSLSSAHQFQIIAQYFPKLALLIYAENAKLDDRKVSKNQGKYRNGQRVIAIYDARGRL